MIFFFFFGASDLLPSVFTVVVFSSVFGVSNCLYCSFPDLLNLSFIISIVKPPYRRLYHAGYLPDSFSSAFMIAFANFRPARQGWHGILCPLLCPGSLCLKGNITELHNRYTYSEISFLCFRRHHLPPVPGNLFLFLRISLWKILRSLFFLLLSQVR